MKRYEKLFFFVLLLWMHGIVGNAKNKDVLNVAIAVNYSWNGIEPEKLPFIEKLTEEANVDIKWSIYDQNEWSRQLPLYMQEKKQPDIYINCFSESEFSEYQDKFMPLDEIMEKYAPDIEKAYREDAQLRSYSEQRDGRIYGLAVRKPYRPSVWQKWIINQEWLDRLNLKVPETWEELKFVLRAFRDQDANGNGDINDEIPLVFCSFLARSYILTGGTGSYSSSDKGLICDKGEFIYLPNTEQWRETISFIHELYEEGLLCEESATMNYAELQNLGRNGTESRVGASIGWSANEIFGLEREKEYRIMDQPIAREGEVGIYNKQFYDGLTYENHCAQISSVCKNPEAAMRFLNLFYREDYSVQVYYGSYDVGVKKNEDNTYTVLTPDTYGNEEWQRINSMVDNGLYYFPKELEHRIEAPESIMKILDDEDKFRGKEELTDTVALLRMKIDPKKLIESDQILDSLENISLKAAIKFMVQGITEETWNEFQNELYAADLEKLITIYQDAYKINK